MGLDIQAKLLRAIQERAVRPVGSIYEIPINVRIVASTNRNPAEATRTGHLRTDLYYRLETNVLEVVPLRDRVDDVELLALHFLSQLNERNSASRFVATIASDALSALKAYGWPGNVRELNNAIESAFTFGSSPAITLDDLPARIKSAWRLSTWESISSERSSLKTAAGGLKPEVRSTYADFERESIAKALLNTGGNKAQAARILKISRKKLYNRITRYGLQVRLIVGSQLAAAQQS